MIPQIEERVAARQISGLRLSAAVYSVKVQILKQGSLPDDRRSDLKLELILNHGKQLKTQRAGERKRRIITLLGAYY